MLLGTGGLGFIVFCMLVLLAYASTLAVAGRKGGRRGVNEIVNEVIDETAADGAGEYCGTQITDTIV